MQTKLKTGLVAIVIVLGIYKAGAQEPQPLGELTRLLGKWEGPATLKLEGKKYQFTYYADFKMTADGSGLFMEEWFDAPGLGSMKGSNLIGFNANDKSIHWFSVDNLGTTHDHLGKWRSAGHFFMQANEMQGKGKFIEKIDLLIKDNDTLELNLVATLDGKETEKATATFHRKK